MHVGIYRKGIVLKQKWNSNKIQRRLQDLLCPLAKRIRLHWANPSISTTMKGEKTWICPHLSVMISHTVINLIKSVWTNQICKSILFSLFRKVPLSWQTHLISAARKRKLKQSSTDWAFRQESGSYFMLNFSWWLSPVRWRPLVHLHWRVSAGPRLKASGNSP